jgi:predicted TIM-barrel fold metal-dependent hydrolase
MPVDQDEAGLQAWRVGMQALAQQQNVAVKISGLAMLDWQWTLDSLRPFVLQTIELFGTERCLFASNFPVDRLFGSFARHYGAYQTLTATLSATERAQVFVTNAERIYRI